MYEVRTWRPGTGSSGSHPGCIRLLPELLTSAATIMSWSSKLAQDLREDFDSACVNSLIDADVIHADETLL